MSAGSGGRRNRRRTAASTRFSTGGYFVRIPITTIDTAASTTINTAPSTVITKTMAEHFQPGTIIIDIASNQVGVEPAVYEMPHICVKAAPGLPGLVAEQSAGEILADYIERNFLKKTGF